MDGKGNEQEKEANKTEWCVAVKAEDERERPREGEILRQNIRTSLLEHSLLSTTHSHRHRQKDRETEGRQSFTTFDVWQSRTSSSWRRMFSSLLSCGRVSLLSSCQNLHLLRLSATLTFSPTSHVEGAHWYGSSYSSPDVVQSIDTEEKKQSSFGLCKVLIETSTWNLTPRTIISTDSFYFLFFCQLIMTTWERSECDQSVSSSEKPLFSSLSLPLPSSSRHSGESLSHNFILMHHHRFKRELYRIKGRHPKSLFIQPFLDWNQIYSTITVTFILWELSVAGAVASQFLSEGKQIPTSSVMSNTQCYIQGIIYWG